MFETKYIATRADRRTYLKGSFRGKFVGRLDLSRSDPKQERFYDIEVLEGEIETRQDHLVPWMEGKEPHEFSMDTVSPTRLPGKIGVTLHYLNGEVKHFKIALKQIKLIDCHLSGQVYARNEVHGTITGLLSGYVLHPDMLVKEIVEEEPKKITEDTKKEDKTPKVAARRISPGVSPGIEPSPGRIRVFRIFAVFIGLGLLIGALIMVKNWIVTLLSALGTGLLIRLLQNWTRKRYGSKISGTITAFLSLLALAGLAFYLAGHYQDYLYPGTGKTKQTAIANTSNLKKKAADLFAQNHYQDALELYNQLLEIEAGDPALHYQRALCYAKLNRIEDAVGDLRLLVSKGDTAAIAFNNRINPIKVRQIGTVIRCNDGTISKSKNRKGTCSGHGGVKNWEEKVYEEYREYK